MQLRFPLFSLQRLLPQEKARNFYPSTGIPHHCEYQDFTLVPFLPGKVTSSLLEDFSFQTVDIVAMQK